MSIFVVFILVNSLNAVYDPLMGVPKIPTASSAQISIKTIKIVKQIAIRYLIFFVFLITSSHITPVPSRSAPATTKSSRVHFTSSVNCIAISGMSNRIAEMSTIRGSLLFCIIINVLISLLLISKYKRFFK
jgi:hypothetical protein